MRIHPRFWRYYQPDNCGEWCKSKPYDCLVFASCGPEMRCARSDEIGEGIIPCSKCACWTGKDMTPAEIAENVKLLKQIVIRRESKP